MLGQAAPLPSERRFRTRKTRNAARVPMDARSPSSMKELLTLNQPAGGAFAGLSPSTGGPARGVGGEEQVRSASCPGKPVAGADEINVLGFILIYSLSGRVITRRRRRPRQDHASQRHPAWTVIRSFLIGDCP